MKKSEGHFFKEPQAAPVRILYCFEVERNKPDNNNCIQKKPALHQPTAHREAKAWTDARSDHSSLIFSFVFSFAHNVFYCLNECIAFLVYQVHRRKISNPGKVTVSSLCYQVVAFDFAFRFCDQGSTPEESLAQKLDQGVCTDVLKYHPCLIFLLLFPSREKVNKAIVTLRDKENDKPQLKKLVKN